MKKNAFKTISSSSSVLFFIPVKTFFVALTAA